MGLVIPGPLSEIVGGLFIPYSEGRAWLQRAYGIDLPNDHSQDITIMWYLLGDFHERGYSDRLQLTQAQDTDPATLDLLVITQGSLGQFLNVGPAGIEEVVQDDLKDTLKPGENEKKVRKVLLREFGRWTHDYAPCNQMILSS